jgi:CDP-diglyceride synthetase
MQDTIEQFQSILDRENITTIQLSETDSELLFTTSLLNHRIYLDLIVVGLAIYGNYEWSDRPFYQLIFVPAYIILFIVICAHFTPINKLHFDCKSKTLLIKNRNVFTRLFLKSLAKEKELYEFSEIKSFAIRSNDSFQIDMLRFMVDLKTKDGEKRVLVGFPKENQALAIANYFGSLLK